MEDIILYNEFHNGDLFYSRIFLNMLKNKFKINYFHTLNKPLFCDIEHVTEYSDMNLINSFSNKKIINTWIGQDGMQYIRSVNTGCSFENHFFLSKLLATKLGVTVDQEPLYYLPEINYSKLSNIEVLHKRMENVKTKFKKIILISSGPVHSGQSENHDFTPIIQKLSTQYLDYLFITTAFHGDIGNNVIHSSLITNVSPDLLHISFISTYCDIIVGRASGPFCFCHTKENLLNENKTFISFSTNMYEGVFCQEQKSKKIWTNSWHELYNILLNQKL